MCLPQGEVRNKSVEKEGFNFFSFSHPKIKTTSNLTGELTKFRLIYNFDEIVVIKKVFNLYCS